MAGNDAGGQAGIVGTGDANAVNVNANQFFRAQFGGKIQRHVIPPAAVNVIHAVNTAGPQCRKTGAGGQQIVLELPLRNILHSHADAFQRFLDGHHKAELDGRMTEQLLIQIFVDGVPQRFHVQTAAVHHILEKVPQFLPVGGFRGLQNVVNVHRSPQFRRLVQLAHGEHSPVQAAHAGSRDDVRPQPQLQQCLISAHLITSFCSAACQNQSQLSHGLSSLLRNVTLLVFLIIPFSNGIYQ